MLIDISFFSFDTSEFKIYYRLYNDPQNNPWMHYSRRHHSIFYNQVFLKQSQAGKVFIYSDESQQAIGCGRLILTSKGPYKNIATIASICIDPKFKSRGHGKKLVAEITQFIKNNYPHIIRLELTFEMDNPVAMLGKVYDKAGFTREASFSNWFRSKDEIYQKTKHPWYSGEWFCGKLLHSPQPRSLCKNETHLPSATFAGQKAVNHYFFGKATLEDISRLLKLYDYSLTALSHYSVHERKEYLQDVIADNNTHHHSLFIVCNSEGEIVCACELDEQPIGLEQLAVMTNAVVDPACPEAANLLFAQLIKYYQPTKTGIKQIEAVIPSANKDIITAIQNNGYEHTGTRDLRFCDIEGNYFDELYFEYNLFGLEDAINCCQLRLKAEINLACQGNDHFYLPLSVRFLNELTQKLHALKNHTKLTFVEEKLLFKLVSILCTQDCISAEERAVMYENLNKNNEKMTTNQDIKKIYDLGMHQLMRFIAHPEFVEEKKMDIIEENKCSL